MKKVIIAASVAALLGGVWIGGSWYTGKHIQDGIHDSLAQFQSYIDGYSPDYQAKVNITSYERTLFSSRVTYSLDVATKHNQESIAFEQTIQHGPFPRDNLSLLPKLASSQLQLINQPFLEPLFELTEGESPLTLEMVTAYNGDSAIRLTIAPFTAENEDESEENIRFNGVVLNGQFTLSGEQHALTMTSSPVELRDPTSQLTLDTATIALNQDSDKRYAIDLNLGELSITSALDEDEQERILLNGLSIKSRGQTGKFDMGMGRVEIDVPHAAYSINNEPQMAVDNFILVSNAQEDEKFITQTVDTHVDQLYIEGTKVGALSWTTKLDRFDGQSLNYLNKNAERLGLLFLGFVYALDDDEDDANNLMMDNLMAFFDGNPSISLSPLRWENDRGESQLDVSLTLMRPASLEFNDLADLLLSVIQDFNSSVKLSIPMMTEVSRLQYLLADGLTEEESEVLAIESVNQFVEIAVDQQLLSQPDENTVTSHFNYADGTIDLNGQEMNIEQFIQRYLLAF